METSNIKVNEAEKVDNTKITAQMLSEQERLSAQITDNRREITELTEAELKELESLTKQYGRSFEYHKCLMHFKHIGGRNSRGCTSYRILRLHPQEFP